MYSKCELATGCQPLFPDSLSLSCLYIWIPIGDRLGLEPILKPIIEKEKNCLSLSLLLSLSPSVSLVRRYSLEALSTSLFLIM